MPLSSSYLACSCELPMSVAYADDACRCRGGGCKGGPGWRGSDGLCVSKASLAGTPAGAPCKQESATSASAGNPRWPPRTRRSRNEVSASRFACGWRGRLSCRAMQNLARPGRARASASLCRDKPRRDGADDIDYRANGFILEKRIILDGWTTLVIVRRNGQALRD